MDKTPAKKEAEALKKGQEPAPKHHLTLFDKIKRRIEHTRMVFGVVSMLLYTVFTVIMLRLKWGSTVYLAVIMGFVGLYVLLFSVLLVLQSRRRSQFKSSLKNYKSGLKILKALLTLINFGLTLSVFIQAAGAKNIGTPFQVTVLVVSLTWALFQIGFQIGRIRKRHNALKKEKKEGNIKKQ